MNKKQVLQKGLALFALSLSAGGLLLEREAGAFVWNPNRCETDSLEQTQTAGRNAWFKKCEGLRMYKGYFSHGEFAGVNNVIQDRRVYVTYGVMDPVKTGSFSYPDDWRAPTDESKDCDFSGDYTPIGLCTGGCYAPEQKLLFVDGFFSAVEAFSSNKNHLVTLSPQSSAENLVYQVSPVKNYITSIVETQHQLLEFRTASGGTLRVTENHPILDQNRKMREASSFQKGDSLVRQNGDLDLILDIAGSSHYGKVYNLDVASTDDLENILVAQGYLNGSLYYQNGAGVDKLNQILFRKWIVPASLE